MHHHQKKAHHAISEIPCLEPSHDKYINKIYLDSKGSLTFGCPECCFEDLIDERKYEKKFDLEDFMEFLFDNHSSIQLRKKLFQSESEFPDEILKKVEGFLTVDSQNRDTTYKTLKKEFQDFRELCQQTLESVLVAFEKKLVSIVSSRMEHETMAFKKVYEVLNYQRVLCNQITKQKPQDLKNFLENYLKSEAELALSDSYYQHQKKFLDDVKKKVNGQIPLNAYIPEYLGISSSFQDLSGNIFFPSDNVIKVLEAMGNTLIKSSAHEMKQKLSNSESIRGDSQIDLAQASTASIVMNANLQEYGLSNATSSITIDNDEGIAKKLLFKKKVDTLILKPPTNSNKYWTSVEMCITQEKMQISNLIVQSQDSIFAEKHGQSLKNILNVQKNLGSIALNLKNCGVEDAVLINLISVLENVSRESMINMILGVERNFLTDSGISTICHHLSKFKKLNALMISLKNNSKITNDVITSLTQICHNGGALEDYRVYLEGCQISEESLEVFAKVLQKSTHLIKKVLNSKKI